MWFNTFRYDKKYVVENNCNLGIAYDGDGDRCLAIDEKGNEIDGDRLLAVISNYMKKKGTLKWHCSCNSNEQFGFKKICRE